MMNEIRCWILLSMRLMRYLAYRVVGGKCPSIRERFPEGVVVFNRVLRWRRRLRIEGLEHCPASGPAIFAGNHLGLGDPFFMYPAIYWGSAKKIEPFFMMRDDFFDGAPAGRFIGFDELMNALGAYLISRERVKVAQLRPFMKILREDQCFLMYPGRSRTRSGMLFEYRDGVAEPGSVSFFVAHSQHGRPETKVPVVPLTRTYNPVTKGTVVVVGKPLYLPPHANRRAQREFDFRLVERLGEGVEINVPQILCGLLYLRCLHGMPALLPAEDLARDVRVVLDRGKACRTDPAALANPDREVKRTLTYLAKRSMIRLSGGRVLPDAAAILAAPELDTEYRKKNPVKYIFNHILHVKPVVAAIEDAALGSQFKVQS